MDALDIEIAAMVAADLTDMQILTLVRVRVRYAREPGWPASNLDRLAFYRDLAERGLIGGGDRYPSLTRIMDLSQWTDFAGPVATRAPDYSG